VNADARGRPLHVFHIGKTGGTALKEALLGQPCGAGYELLLHGHDFTLAETPEGEAFMFFLRDPISLFVSAFNSRLRESRPRYHYPWRDEEKAAFAVFETPDGLATALSSDDADLRGRAHAAMQGIGHLNTSFWYWLVDEGTFRSRIDDVFFIGFQDRLDDDFELLKRKLDLPRGLRLPTDGVAAHRSVDGDDLRLSPLGEANLACWYARDIELVAVCRELAPEINGREPQSAR
jgi:hypothetical protein